MLDGNESKGAFSREPDRRDPLERRKIDDETTEWTDDLETTLPIEGLEIPSFKAWINWNGFQYNPETDEGHKGFDFAAYLTSDNRVVLGLPPDVRVRAVADGVVRQIRSEIIGEYLRYISIEHGREGSGLFSAYGHIVPLVDVGAQVKKGDVIGTLYKDPGEEEGRLVHCHLELTHGWDKGSNQNRRANPAVLDSSLYRFNAVPQGSVNFSIPLLPEVKIDYANFRVVKVGFER